MKAQTETLVEDSKLSKNYCFTFHLNPLSYQYSLLRFLHTLEAMRYKT